MSHGKAQVYEPAIRVPLLMRGPGVPGLVRRGQLVTNADLAPTILDAAWAAPGRLQDGRSLLPLARDPALGRDRPLLVEIGRGIGLATTAVRTRRWLYAERAGGAGELYDLRADPHELRNLGAARSHARVRMALARTLAALERCRGWTCRQPLSVSGRSRPPRAPLRAIR
jgi:arylsulfatase A-like enzyme